MRPTPSAQLGGRLVAVAVLFALIAPQTPVFAAPANARIRAARVEAAEARARLDELAADLEERSEEHLAVEARLRETRAAEKRAEADLDAAENEVAEAEATFDARVNAIYRRGPLDFVAVILGVHDFRDLVTRLDLLRRVGDSDAHVVERLKDARSRAERTRRALENRRMEQVVLLKHAAAKRRDVRDALDAQSSYLETIDRRLGRLIAEERERQEQLAAQAAAAAAKAAKNAAGRGGRPFDPAAIGAPNSRVVDIARRFVGVTPYVWGGTTPSGFDCSGLTMYSYRQIGINIPRTSREQYRFGAFIPPDRTDLLQPGDLVFFGRGGDPNRVHHVGIYAGSGSFIHAPQTGMKVSVSSLTARIQERGDYVGATRP